AAILGVSLDVHLPRPAVLVEVVDVERAEVDLERVEDLGDRDAHELDLVAVDVEEQPGGVGAEAGEEVAIERGAEQRVGVPLADDAVGDGLERIEAGVAAVLDDDLEAAGGAQALDRRCAEDGDLAL